MPTKLTSVLDLATAAIQTGVQLVGQFNDGPLADPERTQALFDRLRELVRALPPSEHLVPQFQANLDDWPQVWEQGEYAAARYQMVQLVRKLRNYRDDWGPGDVSAALPAEPPDSPLTAAVVGGRG